jgi:hypothetical protein
MPCYTLQFLGNSTVCELEGHHYLLVISYRWVMASLPKLNFERPFLPFAVHKRGQPLAASCIYTRIKLVQKTMKKTKTSRDLEMNICLGNQA